MEPKTMYKCTGECKGVTDEAGKSCAAQDCDKHNEPLTACTQCEGCAAKTAEDGAPHACDMCKSL